jgi:AmpD protein
VKLDTQGWLSGVRRTPSPNSDARPAHTRISLLVIHNISLPPDEFGGLGIDQLFTNTLPHDAHPYYDQLRGIRVSAHFLIRRTGEIVQYVSCHQRAWHAGVSVWQGRERCNDFSIGIELEGSDFIPFTELQYRRLSYLSRRLKNAFPICGIAGHADIAPQRKTDPGPHFDWQRYLDSL